MISRTLSPFTEISLIIIKGSLLGTAEQARFKTNSVIENRCSRVRLHAGVSPVTDVVVKPSHDEQQSAGKRGVSGTGK